MVWGSPLVIGSLWSDFLSLGGFISRVNRGCQARAHGHPLGEITGALTNLESSASTSRARQGDYCLGNDFSAVQRAEVCQPNLPLSSQVEPAASQHLPHPHASSCGPSMVKGVQREGWWASA